MVIVCAYAATLVLAALVSQRARRSILSTAVVFLVAGFLLGSGMLGVVNVQPDDAVVANVAQLALFAVLFSDGMRLSLPQLRTAGRLPGRALLFGMPLTFGITAVLAHALVGQPWSQSFLVGAVLSPTDPVFAAAIVGREEVPYRLRSLLNIESGLNDGLALPAVVLLLANLRGQPSEVLHLLAQVAGGIALGFGLPLVVVRLRRFSWLATSPRYESLIGVAVGLLVLSVADVTGANVYLAAFTAGATIASISPEMRRSFEAFGEEITELLKLAALLLFGALISPALLGGISVAGYVFAAGAIVLARPMALALALARADLTPREWVAAAWFGPKGFASVVYALLILGSGVSGANEMFHVVAIVIAASIVAHSSTDVVVARWFAVEEGRATV
jgi:sodium/hydrogen antiporter